jgi:superoxide dismutase, Cu-Zn family
MKSPLVFLGAFVIASAGMTWYAVSAEPAEPQPPTEGVAVVMPTKGQKAHGVIVIKQEGDLVRITGSVSGLTPGKHGFHIHEYGDLRGGDGMAAGAHFSPKGHEHGGPDDAEHHAGDLGNITANADGVATVNVSSKDLELHFIVGRAVVVHEKADDLKSQPAGDAGARIAVGVIGFANKKNSTAQRTGSTTR